MPAAELPQVARQLVRRGDIDVKVEDVLASRTRAERVLSALGGRIAWVRVYDDERANYSMLVPADRLDALMDSVAALGHVDMRSVSATDVTEQVIDTEARVGALRASRDRLRQLLDRATNVQDVVTVERELARVQGELESLEGRLNSLRGRVAMSELAASIVRRPVLGPLGLLAQGLASLITKLFVWR
jgi:hypothetical protein